MTRGKKQNNKVVILLGGTLEFGRFKQTSHNRYQSK